MSTKHHFAIALISLLLMISSCTQVDKASYPPDFIYLDNHTVKSSMHQLATSMHEIDRQLENADSMSGAEIRKSIIDELNNMEKIANHLGAGTATTNHLFIDQHIDLFKSDVIQARRFIQAEPSNYYLAGKLVGSCISCHIIKPNNQILMKHDG